MTRKELAGLKPGTLLYNGRTEGVIKMDNGEKVISIYIPIDIMSNASSNYDDKPEYWEVIED